MCKGQSEEVTWSAKGPKGDQGETGAQGPEGPEGPAGGLSCADEIRINAAAPAFELSPECGLVIYNNFAPDGSFGDGTVSAILPDGEGKPFSWRAEVAQAFMVPPDQNMTLESLNLALGKLHGGPNELDVWVLGDREATDLKCPDVPNEPDDANVVEHWRLSNAIGLGRPAFGGVEIHSMTQPVLEAGALYWVMISTPEPGSAISWWSDDTSYLGFALRGERDERFDIPFDWCVHDHTGVALKVTANAVEPASG